MDRGVTPARRAPCIAAPAPRRPRRHSPPPRALRPLQGRPWTKEALEGAQAALRSDVSVAAGAPGGRSEYRNSLAASFLFKFFARVAAALEADAPEYAGGWCARGGGAHGLGAARCSSAHT
jgi:hypothetical protein